MQNFEDEYWNKKDGTILDIEEPYIMGQGEPKYVRDERTQADKDYERIAESQGLVDISDMFFPGAPLLRRAGKAVPGLAKATIGSDRMRKGQLGSEIPTELSVPSRLSVEKSLKNGDPQFIRKLPKEDRQMAVDEIWSVDTMEGVGATSNTYSENVSYNGFTIKAKPSDFIDMASEAKFLDTQYMSRQVSYGEKLGPPFLTAHYDEATNTLKIGGHEGRHRVEYVRKMFGNDVDIPIHITDIRDTAGYEMKNTRIKREGVIGKATKWVDQDGNNISSKVSEEFKYNLYQALGLVGAERLINNKGEEQ